MTAEFYHFMKEPKGNFSFSFSLVLVAHPDDSLRTAVKVLGASCGACLNHVLADNAAYTLQLMRSEMICSKWKLLEGFGF